MQAQTYEGYFEKGKFYTAGRQIDIPERQRIFVAIFDDLQLDIKKRSAWNEFKNMILATEHETPLLNDEIFLRRESGRNLINFADEV